MEAAMINRLSPLQFGQALSPPVSKTAVLQFIHENRIKADWWGGRYWIMPRELARFQAIARPAGYPKGKPRKTKQTKRKKDQNG